MQPRSSSRVRVSALLVALRWLSRREHSHHELEGRLQQSGYTQEEIANVLVQLKSKGWQSDQRFAEGLVRKKAIGLGRNLILAQLQAHHISEEHTKKALELLEQNDCQRAIDWLEKRSCGKGWTPQNQVKWFRALFSRGFQSDDIKQAMRILKERLQESSKQF